MKCSFCSGSVSVFMDLGEVALAGGFLKPEQFARERKYPLRVGFCHGCHAVQVCDRVDPETMFRDYFYFSGASETMRAHFRYQAAELKARFSPIRVVEIGCNDGSLLREFRALGVNAVGVDPSSTAREAQDDLPIVNEFFTREVAEKVGRADLVVANNVFAHVEDIHGMTSAVIDVLTAGGAFMIETHSLLNMVDSLQYDWIYHEHLYYYSLLALSAHLERHGLEVFDVVVQRTHGGSRRYFVGHKGAHEKSANVEAAMAAERSCGLDRFETFQRFAERSTKHMARLREAVEAKQRGGVVVGYGASGRAAALIQATGIELPYIVDDAPAKQGYFMPGSHIPVVPRSALDQATPDAVLLFAWTYLPEVEAKCDVPMIVPFPTIQTRSQSRRLAA